MKHCEIDIAQGRRSRCVTWTGSSVGRELQPRKGRLSRVRAPLRPPLLHRQGCRCRNENNIIIHLTKAAEKDSVG